MAPYSSAENYYCFPSKVFYKGWARMEGEKRPALGNKDSRRQTQTETLSRSKAEAPSPGVPLPTLTLLQTETWELADWAPCNTPHRHLSAVCIKVRERDAASNLKKGSGLHRLPYPQPKEKQPDSTSFAQPIS